MIKLRAFWIVLLALPAFAAGRVQCSTVKSQYMPAPVGYCALLPSTYDAQPAKKFPALYFLHGLGGDQAFLVESGGWNLIADLQEQKRIGEFVVITPAAGNTFYIDSENGRARYENFFLRDFMPPMEKRCRLMPTRSG